MEESKKNPESLSESARKRRETSADVQLDRADVQLDRLGEPSSRIHLPRAAKCQLKKDGSDDEDYHDKLFG